MADLKVKLKSSDNQNVLHPETDDDLILNKKLLTDDSDNIFEITDNQNNSILEIDQEGNLKTPNFDSTNIKGIEDYNELENKPVLNEDSENAFEISDESGNTLLSIDQEGNLKTQAFDSTKTIELPITTEDSSVALEISDESGNTVLEVDNVGNLKTANFDSSEIQSPNVDDVQLDGKSIVENKVAKIKKDDINNISDIQVDGESILKDKVANIDSSNFGKVDDVKVNDKSVVTDKVAIIEIPDSPVNTETSDSALEINDSSNNTVLEIDSEGNLKTKNFDSTDYYTKTEVDALIKTLTEKIEALSK